MLFSTYTTNFLEYQRDILQNSAGEMDQKALCLRNHLVPYFGEMTFDGITKRKVQEYVAAKRKAGLAIATVNHHLGILRRYLNHAQENGYLEHAPTVSALKMPKREEENYLTPAQVKQLIIEADKHRRPGWRLMIIIAVNTGLRIGEMLALDWKHVEFDNKRLRIRNSYCRKSMKVKSTKSGEPRSVPLNAAALQAFTLLHSLEGKPSEGLVMKSTYDTAQRAMASISKRADLGKTVTWHTLRHTFATALVCAGEPLYVVSRLLGHSTITMSERYAHLTSDRSNTAVRVLDGVL